MVDGLIVGCLFRGCDEGAMVDWLIVLLLDFALWILMPHFQDTGCDR